mmetsp:Transcript_8402/g.15759  ORF Transcript_8402/g.15759 Transcript_8402/m.15759 type:complete len:230 (+) Transcript_8402:620-1309(+)
MIEILPTFMGRKTFPLIFSHSPLSSTCPLTVDPCFAYRKYLSSRHFDFLYWTPGYGLGTCTRKTHTALLLSSIMSMEELNFPPLLETSLATSCHNPSSLKNLSKRSDTLLSTSDILWLWLGWHLSCTLPDSRWHPGPPLVAAAAAAATSFASRAGIGWGESRTAAPSCLLLAVAVDAVALPGVAARAIGSGVDAATCLSEVAFIEACAPGDGVPKGDWADRLPLSSKAW